jgi:hypothetical protein
MPQWEYCRIKWMVQKVSAAQQRSLEQQGFSGVFKDTGSGTVAQLGVLSFFGQPAEQDSNITSLRDTMTSLGQQGWELVSHTWITEPSSAEAFYFKRPVQE